MTVNLSSVIQFWKTFDLPKLQHSLDQTATDLAGRQDESEASRKRLVEQMKMFKRSSSDEVRKSVSPLLKSFQTEIDSLTKRSKASEADFLNLYKKVIELPNPVSALDQAETYHKKNQRLNDVETENQKLRETLTEYNKEFAEVKNQEVTIKALKEKVKELERQSSDHAQKVIDEKQEELNKEYAEREKRLHDAQFTAATKLSEAEQKVSTLQSALDASQSELFNLKSKYDEETAAKQAELEMILADLDRANQLSDMHQKEVEMLKEQLSKQEANPTTSEIETSNMNQSIDILSRTSMELELASKEKEISQFVEDIQHLQSSMNKLRESTATSIANLEQELAQKAQQCLDLENKISLQSDYNNLKRELVILKSTEFSESNGDQKSLEVLLMEKNRALQGENTNLRASNAQLAELSQTLENKLAVTNETQQEQQALIQKLETDLLLIQSPASVVRSAADGSSMPPNNMSKDFLAEAIQENPGTDNSNNSLLMIVSSQRERFRVRNNELEAENYTHQQTVQRMQNELDTLRGDNVKLYEKIKYLQSYSTSTKVAVDDGTSSRYSAQYENTLDPFTSFNQKEKQRKYMNLSPPEKVTLGVSRMILSSKIGRTVFFFYMLLMHFLLYVVLYKYAYSDDCKRHIAEICYDKFGAQMAPKKS